MRLWATAIYMSGHDACVYALCLCSVYVCACTGLSMTHASTRLLRVGKDTYSQCIFYLHLCTLEYTVYLNGAYICLLIGRASFFSQLQALLHIAQFQALLGHSSSSTSTSTSKNVDPQKQHQQLERIACRSPWCMSPPTSAVTMLPALRPNFSTCVTPGISRHLRPEGKLFFAMSITYIRGV